MNEDNESVSYYEKVLDYAASAVGGVICIVNSLDIAEILIFIFLAFVFVLIVSAFNRALEFKENIRLLVSGSAWCGFLFAAYVVSAQL